MSNAKNQVPLKAGAEVLYKALNQSNDLLPEMTYFRNKHTGGITAKNARRRYAKLMLILDTAIAAEREEANQAKQDKADIRVVDQYTKTGGSQPAAPAPGGGGGAILR